MSMWTAWALVSASIAVACGVACYATESAWPLLGLLFLPEVKWTKGDHADEAHGDGRTCAKLRH